MFWKKNKINKKLEEINKKLKNYDENLYGYTYIDFFSLKEEKTDGLIKEVSKLKAIVAELTDYVYEKDQK